MATDTSALRISLDEQTSFYLGRLAQIDRLLRDPIETLINHVHQCTADKKPFKFPALISDQADYVGTHCPTATALCLATVQRIRRLRRRFAWLTKGERLKDFSDHLKKDWIEKSPSRDSRVKYEVLNSPVFGYLNPLTASYVFWVLLEAGESHIYSGLGFTALFAMVWPLYRRYPDTLSAGARIEPWEPTAYVTANCLLPLHKVRNVTWRRADLFVAIQKNLDELASLEVQCGERSFWQISLVLDALQANLYRLADISFAKDQLRKVAECIKDHASNLTVSDDVKSKSLREKTYTCVRDGITEVVKKIVIDSINGQGEARMMLVDLKRQLNGLFDTKEELIKDDPIKVVDRLEHEMKLRFSKDFARNIEYWQDLQDSANKSFDLCFKLLDLAKNDAKSSHELLGSLAGSPMFETIGNALKALAAANRAIARDLANDLILKDSPRWCRTVMDREIANASAGNDTEYNPSELLSAIAVAVHSKLISTGLQVSDAVSKALLGARPDGSWRSGLPFYSPDDAQGIWPVTSDSVWTLIGAIKQYPDITIADEKLFHYLDWLDRTQRSFSQDRELKSKKEKEGVKEDPNNQGGETTQFVGWSSERLCHSHKIHLATTAFSINAILDIRDLVEYRLLQLCQKRFTCTNITEGLASVEPVDLGAMHSARAHGLLARMIAETQGLEYRKADYGWVLHGPPGSSKTKIAESLSAEMWRNTNKWDRDKKVSFIRITPADFTRMGEDRLDSEARLIFDLISHIRGVTIFFDEIDDILYRRSTGSSEINERPTFMALVVPAMLNRLADLREACPRQEICFLLATNYIENIEPALMRSGRIDRKVPVVYPDRASRRAMLTRLLEVHLKALFESINKEKSKLVTSVVDDGSAVDLQTVLVALDTDQAKLFIKNLIESSLSITEMLVPIVEGTRGRPWANIKIMFEKSLETVFPLKELRETPVTGVVKNGIKQLVQNEFQTIVSSTVQTLKSKTSTHLPLAKNELAQQDVLIDHYTDRWSRGLNCPEFVNEVAHYHFSYSDAFGENCLTELFKSLTDETDRLTVTNKVRAVAVKEGRREQRISTTDGNMVTDTASPAPHPTGAKSAMAGMSKPGGAEPVELAFPVEKKT